MKRLIPFDTHMNYGPMRMAIYSSGIDVTVESDILDNMWGCYSEANRVILIDRRLTYTAKKCVLIHELVHWLHADYQCGMHEQRTRLEAARLLVDSQKYRQAEQTYGGAPWLIASELDLTIQTITDYQQCLHDFAVITSERRCLIGTQA